MNDSPSQAFFANDYVHDYNPPQKWSRTSYLNPHQGEWHPLVRNLPGYAWDFDYFRGVAVTSARNSSFDMDLGKHDAGEYVLLVRYFESSDGGRMNLTLQNKSFMITSVGYHNSFIWLNESVSLEPEEHVRLGVKTEDGFNAISAVALVPKSQYESWQRDSMSFISSKTVITPLAIYSPYANESRFNTSSLESEICSLFPDKTTMFEGKPSSRIQNSGASECASDYTSVSESQDYLLRVQMKGNNLSGFALEGADPSNKTVILDRLGPEVFASSGWSNSYALIHVPAGVRHARFSVRCDTACDIWLGNISLVRLSRTEQPLYLKTKTPALTSALIYANLSRGGVQVNASYPFIFTDFSFYMYNSGVAVYVNGTKAEEPMRIPIYGVLNGFLINQTGEIEINLQSERENIFAIAFWISTVAFFACLIYLSNEFIVKRLVQSEKSPIPQFKSRKSKRHVQ
jgi:hypothetical protein